MTAPTDKLANRLRIAAQWEVDGGNSGVISEIMFEAADALDAAPADAPPAAPTPAPDIAALVTDLDMAASQCASEHANWWCRVMRDAMIALTQLQADNAKLRERLEMDRAYDMKGNLHSMPPGTIPDGIECRDETIKGLDDKVARLTRERDEAIRKRDDATQHTRDWAAAIGERYALRAAGRREGMEEATRQWAHWKDGVQYVGTCGTTLAAALAKIREAAKD